MTYASELTRTQQRLDAVLVIDGIPVLFGTRAGRVHDGVGVGSPPSNWTSVAAIVPNSIRLGDLAMDWDSMLVKPSKVSLEIVQSTAWNKYFETRRPYTTSLAAPLTASATTIYLTDTTGNFIDGQYVYCERETIKLGTFGLNRFTGCTRNAISLAGSRAASHAAADTLTLSSPGYSTTVTTYPQFLAGRQASLRIYAGESDSAYTEIASLRISESPVFDAASGTWRLSFDDGMSFFARKLASGVRANQQPATSEVSSSSTTRVRMSLWPNNQWVTGSDIGHAFIQVPDNGGTFLVNVQSITPGITLLVDVDVNKSALDGRGLEDISRSTVTRCYAFSGYPMECALKVLLSGQGDGSNHATWDTLAGRISDGTTALPDGTTEFCYGANIPAALIDVTTLETFKSKRVDGWFYVLGARGEENLLDLMEEVAWALGGFWFINAAGKLSFRQWTAVYATDASNYTLTEDNILRSTSLASVNDESTVLHTVNMQSNYMPGGSEPLSAVAVVHQPTKNLYRDTPNGIAGTLTVKRKAKWVDGPSRGYAIATPKGDVALSLADPLSVRTELQRIFAKRSRGVRRYSVTLPWRYSAVSPGDRISITFGLLNAFDGTSVTSMVMDVVTVKRNFNDATVEVGLDETIAGKRIAPALRIASYSAGVITLDTNNATWGGGATPAGFFSVGWSLVIHDRSSSPPFSATSTHAITATNSVDTLTISGAPSFTPVAGDIIQFAAYDSATGTTPNGAQGIAQRDYAFLGDDTFKLGAAKVDDAPRWG